VIVARKTLVGLVIVGALALGAGNAFAVTEAITTPTECCLYSKAAFTIDAGQVATFNNANSSSHDVTSNDKGPDGAELFASPTISGNSQTPVNGTQYLAPGSYAFFCTVHPDMVATLQVGAGTPVARPEVTIKVLSKKVDEVASSGKLKLKLTAVSQADDVALVVRKGAKKIASQQNLDLAAGTSRTLKLKLTNAAKNALDGVNSAKVKVTGTLPFGFPADASKKLK
jgi:plastocyanin